MLKLERGLCFSEQLNLLVIYYPRSAQLFACHVDTANQSCFRLSESCNQSGKYKKPCCQLIFLMLFTTLLDWTGLRQQDGFNYCKVNCTSHINMERQELGGEKTTRSFYTSAFGADSSRSSSYLLSNTPSSLSPEPLSPYVSFPNAASCTNSQVTFGCHFANSFYSCKAPPSSVFQQRVMNHHSVNGKGYGHLADKQDVVDISRPAIHCSEGPTRVREVGVYQGYAGHYRIPGYIDVPVVQRSKIRDHKHESPFVMDDYEPWNWSTSWSNQIYCPKEQTTSSHMWKSSLAGKMFTVCHISRPFMPITTSCNNRCMFENVVAVNTRIQVIRASLCAIFVRSNKLRQTIYISNSLVICIKFLEDFQSFYFLPKCGKSLQLHTRIIDM